LEQKGVDFEELAIRETPPNAKELKQMLKAKEALKPLFNSSGMDYRSMGLKDTLPTLTNDEAFELLQSNGNLVKRPFVVGDVNGKEIATVGFKEAIWEELFS